MAKKFKKQLTEEMFCEVWKKMPGEKGYQQVVVT